MKKVFISQPMNGLSEEEIKQKRDSIIERLVKEYGEIYVIDSHFKNIPKDAKPLRYLGAALSLLSEADIAYFAEGWEKARGCRIEHRCAVEYGIKVITRGVTACPCHECDAKGFEYYRK